MAIFKKCAPYPVLTKAVAIFIIVLAPSLANNGNMKKPVVPKQLSNNAILRDGRQDDSGLPYVEELAREQSTTTADVTTTTTETPEARTPESPPEISTSTSAPFRIVSNGKHSHSSGSPGWTCGTVASNKLQFRTLNPGHDGPMVSETFPWHATIFQGNPKGKMEYIGGGTLIHPRFVVTAGDNLKAPSATAVVLGANSNNFWKNKKDKVGKVLAVRQFHRPESFFASGDKPNLLLLELNRQVDLSEHIQPACLPDNTEDPTSGAAGQLPGYGIYDSTKSFGTLKFASLPVIQASQCARSLRLILSSDQYCAGYENGTDTCKGDNGGGQVFYENDRFVIRGVYTSKVEKRDSQSKCDGRKYSVFTSIGFYLDWINSVISKASSELTAGPVQTRNGNSGVATEPIAGRLWWLASIYERLGGHLPYSCGGVLIHPSIVLTSAGCFPRGTDPYQYAITVAPIHGQPQKNAEDMSTFITTVQRIMLHPKFDSSKGFQANIALIKIDPGVPETNRDIKPAMVSTEEPAPGQTGTIAGFYNNNQDSQSAMVLETFTILDGRECMKLSGHLPLSDQFCATTNNSIVTLNRMGTAGFVYRRGGQDYVQGIFSDGFADKESAAFFTSVFSYSEWIKSSMSELLKQ